MPKPKTQTNSYSFFDSNTIVDPKRDWNILIILLFCMILPALFFDAYLYRKIVSGDMYVSVNKEDLVLENLKTNEIQGFIQNFEFRKEKVANMKIEKLIDPSL